MTLEEAIEDLCDWLDYDVWGTVPELEKAVQRVNNARIRLLVQEQRERKAARQLDTKTEAN